MIIMEHSKVFTTKFMIRTSIFGAIATILYLIPGIKLPFFLGFLEIHFDEIPAFIASFAYGPLCGTFVIIIKTLIKLFFSTSAGVGELMDLIYGLALILPASIYYKKNRTFKGAIIGLVISTIVHLLVTFICSATFVIDLYCLIYAGLTQEQVLQMAQLLVPQVSNVHASIAFYCFLPFNLFKDVIITTLTILLYPRVRYFTEKRYKK